MAVASNSIGSEKQERLPSRPLMQALYDFFLALYVMAIKLVGLFNEKAGKWVSGRKDWRQNYAARLQPGERRIWFHCSSVGEFEQARPLIEAMRTRHAGYKIVVTFFSPSGYEACGKNGNIDYAFYLPADTRKNAEEFVRIINPALVAFVKYEFWYHYLAALRSARIPTVLVSGAFRKEQPFFKWYGGLFCDMLACFSHFFLQDEESVALLHTIGVDKNITVSGDTRYDRVAAIAANLKPIPAIEAFKENNRLLVAGSTWPADEQILKQCISVLPSDWKVIIAPHEIDAAHIRHIEKLFGAEAILFSALDAETTGADKRILIINNIGMLSRLFAYADTAYIGGGFARGGIHNILEPSVFGAPVVFGPIYEKFVEAKEMAALQIVFPINDAAECRAIFEKLVEDEYRGSIRSSVRAFMQRHTGATDSIIGMVREQGWL